jgi:uncharacterized protein
VGEELPVDGVAYAHPALSNWQDQAAMVKLCAMKALSDIVLQPVDRLAIEVAAQTVRALFPVAEVILFGSKARGSDDPESDIDLLVLTTRELSWSERAALMDSLYPIQLEHDVVISPLVVSVKEWQEGVYSVLPIRQEVGRHGIAA